MTAELTLGVRKQIAARVRAEMASQGLRNTHLAERLHVSEMWVGRRLRVEDPQPFRAEDLARVAAALGIPMSRLLPEPEEAAA